jgi:simple sugar transport system substrate-binding protein
MAGYLAALVIAEASAGAPAGSSARAPAGSPAPAAKRIGLVAAQEYPVMNNVILPGFIEGAQAIDPDFSVDFRVVGNWFDAAKAAELAAAMIRGGARVLLPIAGGAGHGVIQAASEAGAKVVWFDTNGYAIRPGTVIGSAILRQDLAAYDRVTAFLNGTLPFGKAEVAGMTGGFVDFVEDDPDYIAAVSQSAREKQARLISRIRSGDLKLD